MNGTEERPCRSCIRTADRYLENICVPSSCGIRRAPRLPSRQKKRSHMQPPFSCKNRPPSLRVTDALDASAGGLRASRGTEYAPRASHEMVRYGQTPRGEKEACGRKPSIRKVPLHDSFTRAASARASTRNSGTFPTALRRTWQDRSAGSARPPLPRGP